MSFNNCITFGPVPSRRLGKSLGVNNIPPKYCSYSCVYCQVGITKNLQEKRTLFYQPVDIYNSVKNRIIKMNKISAEIDYISFVPDGEPTLDINLSDTINLLKDFNIKIAVITNASLLWDEDVRNTLCMADYVSIKIDAVDEKGWRSINRPAKILNLDKILNGIEEFGKIYNGKLTTETMLVDNHNTGGKELESIAKFIKSLQPQKAYLAIPIRPAPIDSIRIPTIKVSCDAFKIFKKYFDAIELLIFHESNDFYFSNNIKEDFLNIISVHPMRKKAVEKFILQSGNSWNFINDLIKKNQIREFFYNGEVFYIRNF